MCVAFHASQAQAGLCFVQIPCARCVKKGIDCVSQRMQTSQSTKVSSVVATPPAASSTELERILGGKPTDCADESGDVMKIGPKRAPSPTAPVETNLFPEILAAIAAISAPDSAAASVLDEVPLGVSLLTSAADGSCHRLTSERRVQPKRGRAAQAMFSDHAACQVSGTFGAIPRQLTRYNKGSFVLDSETCLEPNEMGLRLRDLLQGASDQHLARVLYGSKRMGGLPLRLLEPAVPSLGDLLLQRLQRSHSDVLRAFLDAGRPSTDIVYDGLHLTLVGFAAALVAWLDDDTLVVTPPPHCIISAPEMMSGEHDDDGSQSQHASPSADTKDNGHTDCVSHFIGKYCVPLSVVFQRWSHLAPLSDGAQDDALQDCREFVQSLHKGKHAFPSTAICDLYADHLMYCSTPCMASVHGEAGGPPVHKALNCALAALLGFQSTAPFCAHQAVGCTPDPSGAARVQPLRWLHPSSIITRTLAFLSAQNLGLRSFQMETRYMRPCNTGDVNFPAVSSDMYTSLFVIETCHVERHRNGRLLAFTSYLSDVVHCPTPECLSDDMIQAAELDAIDTLVLQRDKLPLEMAVAMRRLNADPAIVLAQSVSDRVTAGLFIAMANLALQPQHQGGQHNAPQLHGAAVHTSPVHSDSLNGTMPGPALLSATASFDTSTNPVSGAASTSSLSSADATDSSAARVCPASVSTEGAAVGLMSAKGSAEPAATHIGSAAAADFDAARSMLQLQHKSATTKDALLRRIPPRQLVQLFDFVSSIIKRCQERPTNLVTRLGHLRLTEPHPMQSQGHCLQFLQTMRDPRDPKRSVIDSLPAEGHPSASAAVAD